MTVSVEGKKRMKKTTVQGGVQVKAANQRVTLTNGKSCLKSLVAIVDTSDKDHWLFLKNQDNDILIAAQYPSQDELDIAVMAINDALTA